MAKRKPKPLRRPVRAKRAKGLKKPVRRRRPSKIVPDQQGRKPKRTDVGPGRPPVEHQFQPGQSGNPAGAPKARTNLWPLFCAFHGLTDEEVRRIQNDKQEPLNRRTAAKEALQLFKKGIGGTGIIATKAIWDREEGKATEHIQYDRPEALTPEECDEIRRQLKGQRT